MQAISRAPPWELADMLAVMKKDMSSRLYKSQDLSRAHQRLTTACKQRERAISLPAVSELAGNVNSLLLALALPNKTDKGAW